MKIDKVLIHEGKIFGIPEGTKVPEKPYPNQGYGDDQYSGCREDEYDRDFQALLSVSIQWEDQEAIRELVPDEALKPFGDDSFLVDGIYPLLGVECEKVWQNQHLNSTEWYDCKGREGESGCRFPNREYRQVLRLIQPNSEQKELTVKEVVEKIQNPSPEFKGVEGTEVSEPTNPMDEYIAGLPDTRELVNSWIGVDEKKQPETLTWEQALKYMKSGGRVRHSYFSDNEWVTFDNGQLLFEDGVGCTVAFFLADRQSEVWKDNWFRVGGVSEEEPTQENKKPIDLELILASVTCVISYWGRNPDDDLRALKKIKRTVQSMMMDEKDN